MGRTNFVSMLALTLTCLLHSLSLAQGPEESIRHARALLADSCKLHGLLESAGAEPFTLRSACRLESAAEELVEKLSCPSHLTEASFIVDECTLWYNRTCVGVRRQGCLADDRAIAASLACTGRQLALVETSVACLLRHGNRAFPNQQPNWNLPSANAAPRPYQGLQPEPSQGFPVPRGAWVNGPFSTPTGSRPEYPFSSEGFAEPAFGPSPFGPSPFSQRLENQPNMREFQHRQAAPTPVPGQRGQIARAVLELMLSEMSR